ncbi:KilA-N domain-containing protein [Nostoc sp. MG11]|uniref:KilA-N domain-containing protein n=1 Tax=Nostoc sp. MG11 TaxID=2721166 RepID=UPI0018670427|nr:KilA-N domain-containing protein [Nostoc sp. MG11]
MSQIEITQILEQIREEIEVDASGKGKASIRATARLADVQDSSIRRAFEGAALEPSLLAQSLIQQGFDSAALQSWSQEGIPDLAVATILEYYAYDAGRYCKKQARLVCKAFIAIGIRVWMQTIKGWDKSEQPQDCSKILSPSHEAAQLALLVGEFAGLEKSLTAQLAVNAATRVNPALKPAADELKSAIACTDPCDDAYLNPTQIGEAIGKSAIAVNKWLINAGLQYRTDDRKLPYRPTELGKQWGRMVSAVARGSNQTVFQLRWLPGVTELFQQYQ